MTKYGPESKDLWILARVEELMDDWRFTAKAKKEWFDDDSGDLCLVFIKNKATEQATREHAEIESMTLNAQIDNLELK